MKYNCLNIVKMTEAHLKLTHDVSLKEATAQELHEALSTSLAVWSIPICITWAFWTR